MVVLLTLSVGFLGYGFWGRAHANALAKLPLYFPEAPEVTREVVIGRDEVALAEAVDQFGFERYSTDWNDAIDDIDVLYNLAPHALHVEPSITALEAGVHVLCEKPLADTLEGAQRMAAAAETSDAVAGVAFNYRFVPAFQYAKGLVDDGVLGEIRDFHGQFLGNWLVDPKSPWKWSHSRALAGSGAHGDLGSHTIDLARYLLGETAGEITHVRGHLRTFVDERPVEGGGTRPVDVDDAYHALVEFENGAMGRLDASRVAAGHRGEQRIEVHGSAGSLRAQWGLDHLGKLELFRHGTDQEYQTIPVLDEPEPYVDRWWPFLPLFDGVDTTLLESRAFLEAIEERHPHETSFEDGLAVQNVVDAIARSDRTGERTQVT